MTTVVLFVIGMVFFVKLRTIPWEQLKGGWSGAPVMYFFFSRVLRYAFAMALFLWLDKRDRLMQAYGLASEYGVILPYNRKQESEADHIGIILMARAGYDPREAPRFWRRFASLKETAAAPEFLSTHPADDRRAADLEKLMSVALREYSAAENRYGIGEYLNRTVTG